MKNNRGFGTREVMIVILLMLSITAFLLASILGGAGQQKFVTFKENASTFAKTMITNQASFSNVEEIYLGEAIHEGFMKEIKNTLGPGKCDKENSKVSFRDGRVYTTFKCGKYLIDDYEIKDLEDIPIYEVSEWSEKKLTGDDVEEIKMYNAYEGDKKIFDHYYQANYFIYLVNDAYNETARSIEGVERKTALRVVDKTFYRTKKLLDIEKK